MSKLTHFNYRVATKTEKGVRHFEFIELFYEEKKTTAYTSVTSAFDSVEDMKYELENLNKALQQPVIDLDNFPNIYNE